MRAIASSTACSGLMPSAATRWTAFAQTSSCQTKSSGSRPRPPNYCSCGGARDLHHRSHVMRVARVEPERLLEQLRHRRQQALAGEVEIVREPALGHQEAHELLGRVDVAAGLEDRGREERLMIGNGSPSGPSGHSIVAVFL